jgi:NADPH2:quinone reductase
MKAILVENFGGPEVLLSKVLPTPSIAEDQILVRMHAAGVNPVDTYIRAGTYGTLPVVPYTPGFDGAGTIEAIGSQVRGYRKGNRVYVSGSLTGTYAEYSVCSPTQLHPLPRQLSYEDGACVGIPYATAAYALFHRCSLKRGQTVLVHGASGGVGVAAVQLARRAGSRVLATVGTDPGKLLMLAQGADAVFNHHQPGYEQQIVAATKGTGVDLIVEMLANVNLGRDLPMLAQGGCVAVVGSRGIVQVQPRELMVRDADIRGVMLLKASPAILGRIHTDLLSGFTDGSLKPVVRSVFELERAKEAHELQMLPGALGKIVLKIPASS